jgi:hypothetical protein
MVGALACGGIRADAQAKPTAGRVFDLQVGGEYSTASSDYGPTRLNGAGFYSTFDFLPNIGAEVDFHQVNHSENKLYERTYELGARYFRHYGRFTPYAKVMYGRGVLNFPQDQGNVAYNMFVGGGGVDIAIKPWLNVRGDYEYQDWLSGPGLPHGLSPQVISIGAAYHFGGGKIRLLN